LLAALLSGGGVFERKTDVGPVEPMLQPGAKTESSQSSGAYRRSKKTFRDKKMSQFRPMSAAGLRGMQQKRGISLHRLWLHELESVFLLRK
jgi:hypothetical protein